MRASGGQTMTTPSRINAILVDREQNIWVASNASGLLQYRASPARLLGRPERLAGDNAYPVLALADGSIWAATLDGGLQHLRGTDPGEWQRPRLPFTTVLSLLASRDGSLWVGGDGVCMLASGECSQHGLPAALQTQTLTRAMFEDAASRLWIGTIWGLWVREQGIFRMLDATHGTRPGRSARAFIETAE